MRSHGSLILDKQTSDVCGQSVSFDMSSDGVHGSSYTITVAR